MMLMPWKMPIYRSRVRSGGRCGANGRASAARRGYDRRHQRLRLMVLREQPICAADGCDEPATELDHIKPLRAGGTDERCNMQGLCRLHHNQKTHREGA